MTKADKNEYTDFIRNYPFPLVYDYCAIPYPALISYNDFRRGKWPDSMIAKHQEETDNYWIAK